MDKLGCKNQYERINPSLGVKIQLDDVDKIDLLILLFQIVKQMFLNNFYLYTHLY